jgi:hypothetical protein
LQAKEDLGGKEEATLHAPGGQQAYFLYIEEPMTRHTPGRIRQQKVAKWM